MSPIPCHAVVERIENLSYNVREFHLKLVDPTRLEFQAGQFMIVNVPKDMPAAPASVRERTAQAGGNVVKRAYSVASAPHDSGVIEFCVQHLEGGIASTYFWGLKEGETLSLNGPHGRFLLKEPVDYDPVFVATGTGVAPLRSMIKSLIQKNVTRDIWLLFGCRYEHALLYDSEFRSLASMRRNFHYIPTVSRPKEWRGEVGYVQQLYRKHITDSSNKEVYLCGWIQIVKAICEDLKAFGVPSEKLHYEEWG